MKRYGLKNKRGQWLLGGSYYYDRCWTDDESKAKLYRTIGQARGRRTEWAKKFPQMGVPDLVLFDAEPVVIDDAVHFAKAAERQRTKKERAAAVAAQWELERAQANFEAAKRRLAEVSR